MGVKRRLDKIRIHDLVVPCIIGINDIERIKKQNVNVNVTMFADIRKPCDSDNIDDTVDYKKVKNNIKDYIKESDLFLVEKMANMIAKICFQENLVEEVLVRVEKPGALTLARTVSVEIFRTREDYGF